MATTQVNGKAKIRPLATPKPLKRFSRNCHVWLCHEHHQACEILLQSFQGFLVPAYVTAMGTMGWLGFGSFLGPCNLLQPTPQNGFLRKIRQRTSFRWRICLLGVLMTNLYIFTPIFRKTVIVAYQRNRIKSYGRWLTKIPPK